MPSLPPSHLFDIGDAQVATTTDDWYTPRWIFDAAAITFDMDVAAPIDLALMLLLPAVPEVRWLGVVLNAADAFTLLAVDFHRPDGTTARLRWPSILAARGSCAAAVARVAACDKYADGGYLVRGVA